LVWNKMYIREVQDSNRWTPHWEGRKRDLPNLETHRREKIPPCH
jgi:hypothetical protein